MELTGVNFRTVDWNKMVIPPLKESQQQKGFRSSVPTIGGKPILIAAPLAVFPFGTSPPNADAGITKWSLAIARDENGGTAPILGEFFDKMAGLDTFLSTYVSANAKEFFNVDKKSQDSIADLLNRTIKYDKNPENAAKYGPSIRPTIRISDTGEFYDVVCKGIDNHPMPIDKVAKRSKGYVTFEVASIYSVNHKACGATLIVRNVRVIQNAVREVTAPPLDMYGDCPPDFEAALMAVHIPEPSTKPEDMYGDNPTAKREREEPPHEEAPAAAASEPPEEPKKAKKSKK